MKKFNIIIALCLMAVLPLQAQFAKPLKSRSINASNSSFISVGITGSFAANDMIYTAMHKGEFQVYLGPTAGIAVEYNTMKNLGIGLDVSYVMRGTKEATSSTFLSSYTTMTTARVNYEMSLKGIEARIPVTLYLGSDETVKPYVYLAPRVSLWLGDSIRWKRTYDDASYAPVVYTHAVDKGTMNPYDISVVAGLGVCSRIMLGQMPMFLKFDLNYGISVLSNFSKEEIAAANEGSEGFVFYGFGDVEHEELGRRHLQNAEARLTVLIPIKKRLKDACAFNQGMRKPK
jgi:hypothetical protein